jgi:hypothetical protein
VYNHVIGILISNVASQCSHLTPIDFFHFNLLQAAIKTYHNSNLLFLINHLILFRLSRLSCNLRMFQKRSETSTPLCLASPAFVFRGKLANEYIGTIVRVLMSDSRTALDDVFCVRTGGESYGYCAHFAGVLNGRREVSRAWRAWVKRKEREMVLYPPMGCSIVRRIDNSLLCYLCFANRPVSR